MREILFKAKRLDNNEWVYGYLVKHPSAIQIGETSPWYIHVPPAHPEDNGGVYNVDPETVCQYTGLADKSGEKIFEGDICLFDDYSGLVSYSEEDGMFVFAYEENIEINFGQIYGTDLEVIGNIYDKQENK